MEDSHQRKLLTQGLDTLERCAKAFQLVCTTVLYTKFNEECLRGSVLDHGRHSNSLWSLLYQLCTDPVVLGSSLSN